MAKSFALETVETSSTAGTGAYALAGIPAGSAYRTFRQEFANGETQIVYMVRNKDNTKWEENRFGTLTYGTPDALARNVVRSTNGDAPVPWAAGDLPLTVYIPANADVHEGAITGWLAAVRHGLLRFGHWFKQDDPSSGLHAWKIFDGTSDIDVGVVDTSAHTLELDESVIPHEAAAWRQLGTASPAAASSVDFENIPSTINHLMIVYEFQLGTDGAAGDLQTYGADGILDTGASDYGWLTVITDSTPGVNRAADVSSDKIAIFSAADNGNTGVCGVIFAANIQASTSTKFVLESFHANTANSLLIHDKGGGRRIEADRITGVRLKATSGTLTGKVTLYGSI